MPSEYGERETLANIPSTTRAPPKDNAAPTQNLAERCARMHEKVHTLLAKKPETHRLREVQRQTIISLGVIGEALERNSLDELSLSYNGGKDCLVLLILYLAALHTHSQGQRPPDDHLSNPAQSELAQQRQPQPLPSALQSVYIVSPNPFPAVTSFVASSAQEYHLSLARYHKPMKEAFASYLADYPHTRAIFVGTRRTDPHGATLTHFDPTTDDWPRFIRIHPVIDWHYADVWAFIQELGVEYCELYDRGYTSLGGTDDTHPNPALETGDGKYRPAYELIGDDEERLGRAEMSKVASV